MGRPRKDTIVVRKTWELRRKPRCQLHKCRIVVAYTYTTDQRTRVTTCGRAEFCPQCRELDMTDACDSEKGQPCL